MPGEFELIEKLKKKIPSKAQGLIGIGDDAALLPVSKSKILFTTDAIVEGVDFLRSAKPEEVGRKALAVNLSDIAAMGGIPKSFVVTIGIPRNYPQSRIEKCYTGIMRLAKQYSVSCVGGDITHGKDFFISIALIGETGKKVFLRSGARRGDWIGVTGDLGGSIWGKHLRFTPRLKEAAFLSNFEIHAAMDISDGFVQDLEHILKSSAKGAQIDLLEIPLSREANTLEHALTDGEDFELLFTVPPAGKKKIERVWKKRFPTVKLSWVGHITGQKGIQWTVKGKKAKFSVKRKGYTHF